MKTEVLSYKSVEGPGLRGPTSTRKDDVARCDHGDLVHRKRAARPAKQFWQFGGHLLAATSITILHSVLLWFFLLTLVSGDGSLLVLIMLLSQGFQVSRVLNLETGQRKGAEQSVQ